MSAGRALIVEAGFTRAALAGARALAAAGWQVGIGSPSVSGLAASSRSVAQRHQVPPAQDGVDAFIAAVNAAVTSGGYDTILPAGDAELLALSANRERIETVVPYPDHDRVIAAIGKLALAERAASSGIAVPRTVAVTEAEVPDWSGRLYVKADLHAPSTGPARIEARPVDDPAEALRRAREISDTGAVPIFQEAVAGALSAFVVVAGEGGEPLARLQQVSERVFPAGAGVSARAQSVEVDEALAARVQRLLNKLGWTGLVQFQFVVPDDGEPRLIDANARLYGSLGLALAAGVNVVAIWAALACGLLGVPGGDGKPGARLQWLEGDLRRAVRERRGGLVADVFETLSYARGATGAISLGGDRRPALRAAASLLRRGADRARRSATHQTPSGA